MSDDFRQQPHDSLSEQIVLGGMLQSKAAAAVGLAMLNSTDLYEPRHREVFATIQALYEAGHPTEIGAVHSKLLTTGRLAAVGTGNYLIELQRHGAAGVQQLKYHASEVAEVAMKRALADVGTSIHQRAMSADGTGAEELAAWASERVHSVRLGTGVADDPQDHLDEAALLIECDPPRWAIPRLLERGERLILTGGEGLGKSTLIRQLAVTAAAGIHPFTHRPLPPVRVQVFELENPRALTHRRYRPLLQAARQNGPGVADRFRMHLEPRGVDLTKRSSVGWMLRRVEAFQPDIVFAGPMYRMADADHNDERAARAVSVALDQIREVCGAALVLEAHSPHEGIGGRTLRPVGSSLWMRWPEFGFGLRKAKDKGALPHLRLCDFQEWRGPRDARDWPRAVRAGGQDSAWPWIDDDYKPWEPR